MNLDILRFDTIFPNKISSPFFEKWNLVFVFRLQEGHSMWLIQHCARDILEALAFLHGEGYVHADLKPRNILWSADDECFKLIDFGLSFKQGNQVGLLAQMRWGSNCCDTQPFLFYQDVKYIQTDGYRAPEAELQNSLAQAGVEADSGCTAAVDLWSLGVILLEMFSGKKLKDTVRSQEWKVGSIGGTSGCFQSRKCETMMDIHLP